MHVHILNHLQPPKKSLHPGRIDITSLQPSNRKGGKNPSRTTENNDFPTSESFHNQRDRNRRVQNSQIPPYQPLGTAEANLPINTKAVVLPNWERQRSNPLPVCWKQASKRHPSDSRWGDRGAEQNQILLSRDHAHNEPQNRDLVSPWEEEET